MTPRQVAALRIRHLYKMQREELMFGIVASTSANFGFCPPVPPRTPESFMLHKLPPKPEYVTTGEEIMHIFGRLRKPGTAPLTVN